MESKQNIEKSLIANGADADQAWARFAELRVMCFQGATDTRRGTKRKYETISLIDIRGLAAKPTREPKAKALAILQSSYNESDGRTHQVQRDKGQFTCLCADIDKGNPTLDDIQAAVEKFFGDKIALLIYSSSSATNENKKWRIIIPLCEALAFKWWSELMQAWYAFMCKEGFILDTTLLSAGQPIYMPNVKPELWIKDKPIFYDSHFEDGEGAHAKMPVVLEWVTKLAIKRAAEEKLKGEARAETKPRVDGYPQIAGFNAGHNLAEMLLEVGYKPSPTRADDWKSPLQTSDSYATHVFANETDGKHYWVSLSDSDKLAKIGHATASGHRCGDAFDIYVYFKQHGDFNTALQLITPPAGSVILAQYQNDGWPTPQPIPDDLPPVPLFDLELLPDALRPWITDIAERMQIPPDIPAVGAVTALSAAIGRRVQIMPKANDDWTVVPNLWGCVVAPPGFMKSPALTEVMKPLHRLESEAHHAYESAHTAWEAAKERTAIANKAATSASIAKLRKDPKAEITATLDEPDEPLATRYIVNNFSLEALGEVLKANPNGVLAFSDEIHGLLMMSQKPGNEGLNEFLLSAWNGDGAFTLDRIVRGIRRIQHVCVAVLGGIQPGRLVEHVRGATHGGGGDSGLIQRFQLMVWPDMRGDWKLVDRMPDKAARDAAERVFERVVSPFHALTGALKTLGGDEDTIDIRRFDTDAQLVFFSWFEELEREIRGDTLPQVMASHLSKYRSLVPSLALIFAVADDVKGAIPLRYLEQAIGWAKYLRPHAERVYACTTHADTQHARALLAKIKDGSVTDGFTPRDVYKKGWRLLDKLGVTKATDLLADLDYLLPIQTRNPAAGRPSVTFNINPKGIG